MKGFYWNKQSFLEGKRAGDVAGGACCEMLIAGWRSVVVACRPLLMGRCMEQNGILACRNKRKHAPLPRV